MKDFIYAVFIWTLFLVIPILVVSALEIVFTMALVFKVFAWGILGIVLFSVLFGFWNPNSKERG